MVKNFQPQYPLVNHLKIQVVQPITLLLIPANQIFHVLHPQFIRSHQ